MDFQQTAQLPGGCHIRALHTVNTANEDQMAQQVPVIDDWMWYDDSQHKVIWICSSQLKRAQQKENWEGKKNNMNSFLIKLHLFFSFFFFIGLQWRKLLFLQTRISCDKNQKSCHESAHLLSIMITKSNSLCTLTDLFSCRLNRNPLNLKCTMIPNHLTNRRNHNHKLWLYTDGNQLPWILQKNSGTFTPRTYSFHAHLHLLLITMNTRARSFQKIKDFLCESILVKRKPFAIVAPVFILPNNKCDLLKQTLFKYVLLEELWHVYGEGNQQTGLQGPLLLNYQHHHFHHILRLSKLPYQQHDLKAVLETTISAFWRTIKRCQTRFLLHCFGSGCQRIKHYLKEDSFSREKGPARFTDGEEGAQ